jgi:hypothetical protein
VWGVGFPAKIVAVIFRAKPTDILEEVIVNIF